MLKLKESPQLTFLDFLLPPELVKLNDELAKIDVLLDDDQFLAPFVERFTTATGRQTIPMETYLRMMYLKFRHQLGYEVLVKEIEDSIKWRIFCHIPFDKPVPHSTTLIKLTKRFGPETIEKLNQILVDKAREKKIVRGRKLRLDTTVVEANVHHPTDASLLSDCARVITRTVKRIKNLEPRIKAGFRDRTRSIKKRIYSISKVLKRRTGSAFREVREITGEIMDIAETLVSQAGQVLDEARQIVSSTSGSAVQKVLDTLEKTIETAKAVIAQTTSVQQAPWRDVRWETGRLSKSRIITKCLLSYRDL